MPIYAKGGGKYGIRNVNATYHSLAQAKRALIAIEIAKKKRAQQAA